VIEVEGDVDLGMAMLIAEMGDGRCQPIASVMSTSERHETGERDRRLLTN
jgi:hypothetical protein